MGDGTSKLRVLIPTTAGAAEVLLLTEEDPAIGRSVACIGGTTTTADIAAGYHAFVARPTGVIETLFGHSCYRLDVSAAIDAGTSWQLGVLAAHALHAAGRLAQENEPADGVIWATGSVRTVDLTVGGVSHIPEKVATSLPRLRQERQAGLQVLVAIPAQNAADLTAEHESALTSAGIEAIKLDRVQPLWDALSIKLPETSKRMASVPAGASRAGITAAPRRRHAFAAAVAALMLVASTAGYLLVRTPLPFFQRPGEPAVSGNEPAPSPRTQQPTPAGQNEGGPFTPSVPARPVVNRSNVLLPEEVPFVSEVEQVKVRDLYLPAPDFKALAIGSTHVFFSTDQKDENTAAAAALAACRASIDRGEDHGGCDLYATGTTVTNKRGRSPMPARPWFVHDPLVERPYIVTDVPFYRPGQFFEMYPGYGRSKAIALGPTGDNHAAFAETSVEQAARRALERCGYDAGVACMIIALDDSFVVPIPKSAKVVGFFRPVALTTLSPQGREEVVHRLASATIGWSALAIGSGGRFGLEPGAASEEAAVSGALQACGLEDKDCKVAVIGPFLVEPSR